MAARKNPEKTRLDDSVSEPSTVAPGDAPADTTDPAEMASAVTPDKAAAAAAGHLTVNSVVKIADVPAAERDSKNDRTETYTAVRPDGSEVTVKHNLETGETSVS
jgi:hypothetical protein